MKAYYNEIEPTAILWLRAAMDAGIITPGKIDDRPIQEIRPADVAGFQRVHFFAGIGGWDIALNLAKWGDSEVWTGSCPCQPFSSAGKQKGKADDRHLWPIWYSLIRESKPPVLFGEQVSSAIAHGWLDDVYQGLEAEGYAVGSAVLPAYSVGRPHKRDRLWFVAESELCRLEREQIARSAGVQCAVDVTPEPREPVGAHCPEFVANAERQQDHKEQQRPSTHERKGGANMFSGCGVDSKQICDVGNANEQGLEGGIREGIQGGSPRLAEPRNECWLECPDGKSRLIEPSIRLLVDGLPGRLRNAALHGYGNAIVPQVAAEFIGAYMEGAL